MRSWFAEFAAGRCNPVQSAYWQAKPSEELYDIAADPYEVRNLANMPEHSSRIEELKAKLRADMLASRDVGLIPEGMFPRLAGEQTIHDYARSAAYPLERILDVADLASDRDAIRLPELMAAMQDPHPVVRYWGATGGLTLGHDARPAQGKLKSLLSDDSPDVRVVAAEALGVLGDVSSTKEALAEVLRNGNLHEALAAQNAVEALWRSGQLDLTTAQALVTVRDFSEPADRIPRLLQEQQ
jgi:HEAT repeat protein